MKENMRHQTWREEGNKRERERLGIWEVEGQVFVCGGSIIKLIDLLNLTVSNGFARCVRLVVIINGSINNINNIIKNIK